jgi:citrate lyase beta subunit
MTDAADLASRLDRDLADHLRAADADLVAQYPGDAAGRQPVHTVYVPADRYHADLVTQWGAQAIEALAAHRDLFAELTSPDTGPDAGHDTGLGDRVAAKLAREPIEDLRIDFEDGYRANNEDADLDAAAHALAASLAAGAAPPFHGIRIKSLEAPTRTRGVRTFVEFVSRLVADGAPLDHFVTTLPKVTGVDQVTAMARMCAEVEQALGLEPRTLRFEIQVETPQSILGPDGAALVARMIHAAERRCTALHYGTYDYSAFCGIAAPYQSMAHPAADHAKLVMQAAAAGTGVRLSDGSTNVLPIGSAADVRRGWQLHLDLVRRSLERGYYQGWDLHPAQLPTRYAATFGFYRDGLDTALRRLRDYRAQTNSAILDEPATARALADFAMRALHCGAATPEEVSAGSGTSAEELAELARPLRAAG